MITSFLIGPREPGDNYLIFDTAIDGKHVFAACGIGRIDRGEPLLSQTANAALNALLDHADDPAPRIVLREIATVAVAVRHVCNALEAADPKDVVFFVCRDDHVYDAAMAALNPQWQTGGAA